MKKFKKSTIAALAAIMTLILTACNVNVTDATGRYEGLQDIASQVDENTTVTVNNEASCMGEADAHETTGRQVESVEKNGDVIILYTSDVHCGIDKGFGYAGLKQIRDTYEASGYTTLLVDEGDYIQGEIIGTVTRGDAIIDLMNDLKYDAAIPGNHEFDYGVDTFLELTKKADFPVICCNFTKNGELVFEPYVIKEAAGMKIAFVGVTTPTTIITSNPKYFIDENGDHIYDFMNDTTGEKVYTAVQKAVDDARAEGADYVYLLGHMGLDAISAPWTYADVIEHTDGIDVFLDGHSHDTEQIVMKNKDGEDIPRSAVGTKLDCIGYSHISKDDGIVETGILSWPNKISAVESLGIKNDITDKIAQKLADLDGQLSEVVGHSDVDLTIFDPEEKDKSGNPIRRIRIAETNLGDLCTDAFRELTGSDVAIINGGGIRTSINKGDITYKDIIDVFPFGNQLVVLEVTGKQILDALEWGARALPDENGGFLQVSGLSYEIDADIKSSCTSDKDGLFTGVSGEYRVKNVTIGDEPLDPEKKYTLSGINYTLIDHGDGHTSFNGADIIADKVQLDNAALIEYIVDRLGGNIGDEYADPYGQGRIRITE